MIKRFNRLAPIYKSAASITILILLINLGLLTAAYLAAGQDLYFGGLLYNTVDGHSYFAKMKEGLAGNWRFTLAYSCEQSEGAYVFLYYLFLGHISRWLNLSIPFVFHLARLINAVLLVYAVAILYDKSIPDKTWSSRALWLTMLGSGMGYVTMFFGTLSDNERVAEAYPFLSIFGNPHFTLGMAIFVAIVICLMEKDSWKTAFIAGGLALALSIVQPFMVVSMVMVSVLYAAWKVLREHRLDYRVPSLSGLGGGLYLLYQYWALTTDPVLAQWTAQNVTPSPAWWDFILCLLPGLLFCLLAVIRRKQLAFLPHPVMIIWLISLIILVYSPYALQRRFMAGIYIPLVALAFLGVTAFLEKSRLNRWLHNMIWALSLPGAIIFLLLPIYGISTRNEAFFLTRGERDALAWLNESGKSGSLVLAGPSMGLFIPTYTQDCVFYGHPFETLNQEANELIVTNLYNGVYGSSEALQYLRNKGVDYILFGPRERALGSPEFLQDLPVAYANPDVIIYAYPGD